MLQANLIAMEGALGLHASDPTHSQSEHAPKTLLDHVLLLSPIASAHESHRDCDLLEVGLNVVHGHFHWLFNGPAKANLLAEEPRRETSLISCHF